MGASVTEDEDIIIFNDESESDEPEIINSQEETSPEASETEWKAEETQIVETEDMISFWVEEETVTKETTETADWNATEPSEENTIEQSLSNLVGEEIQEENTVTESPSIEEQLKDLETVQEDTLEINLEEWLENTNDESLVLNSSDEDTHNQDENQEDISLDLNLETSEDPSSDDFKNQLIEAQDQKDGVSFADMGIDLDKLWDSEWENLEKIEIDADAPSKNTLEAQAEVFWGVALLGLQEKEDTEETPDESAQAEMLDLHDDIGAFWDLSDGMEEVDEGTHDGILEAAILKLVNREKAIDGEIQIEEDQKAEKKQEIAELKKEIKGLQGEVTKIDATIKDLNIEKATTNTTREWLEKMKIAA